MRLQQRCKVTYLHRSANYSILELTFPTCYKYYRGSSSSQILGARSPSCTCNCTIYYSVFIKIVSKKIKKYLIDNFTNLDIVYLNFNIDRFFKMIILKSFKCQYYFLRFEMYTYLDQKLPKKYLILNMFFFLESKFF